MDRSLGKISTETHTPAASPTRSDDHVQHRPCASPSPPAVLESVARSLIYFAKWKSEHVGRTHTFSFLLNTFDIYRCGHLRRACVNLVRGRMVLS